MDEKPKANYFITVNGEQVFTASFVFEQMQAVSARIDRSLNTAVLSLGISIGAVVTLIMVMRS